MKKLLQILFIMGPLLVLGQDKAKKKFTQTLQLETLQENTWSILTDFTTPALWDENVIDARCGGELKKRETCKVIVKGGKIFEVELTDFVQDQSYTVRYKLSSGNVYIQRTLDMNNKTVTETLWYTGISKKTFEKYMGADYQATQEKRMQLLKTALEAK
ncbi:hypothetical protein M3P19_05120 [Muricauda sp. 2012CJ35-5]|uniref:SRPBCC family protein n=1 Tax=Flagellimonas spongiicola TaxID=2942208 RepID=A0ABT0PPS4_9FLAO|nr:hypothetical protein [Allomuricauda spongiicola]MCL6273379.1 hypothetical protein [Allomuricauda spongiicola]